MAEATQKAAFGLDPKKQKIAIVALAAVFVLLGGRLVWRKVARAHPPAPPSPVVSGTEMAAGDPVKILAGLREQPSLQMGRPAERAPLSRNPFGISELFKNVLLGPTAGSGPASLEGIEGTTESELELEAPKGLVLRAVLIDKDESVALVNESYVRKGDELRSELNGQLAKFQVEAIRGRTVILRRLDRIQKGVKFVLKMEPPRFKGRIQ